MDRQYHSIQLTPVAATPAPSIGGRLDMSPELYLAACRALPRRLVMAMLLKKQQGATASDGGDQVTGIHHVSPGGNTVLHLAAREGHEEMIRELYANFGGNSLLSSRNSALDTPLHCAVVAGHDGAVWWLLQLAREYGDRSSLSCKNEAGDMALHLAARIGHGAAVEAMVSQLPELASEVNYAGVSPLYLAVMSESVPAVRAITANCVHASAAGPSLQNALHAAVFQSSVMVDLLLQWKPSLASDVDGSGSSPLHFASSDGNLSAVSEILRAAPPSTARMRDSDGRSALHVAAGMGHSDVVKELLKVCPGATELRDDRGGTFLHAAAKGGRSKVVALAIRKPTLHGLLNAQDGDGNTPLHLAVDARASDVAQALLEQRRVRANVMNNDGHTPLDLAAKSTSFTSMLHLVVTLTAFGAQSRPQRQDHVEQWGGDDIAKGIEKRSDSLAVVAVLIATVAFSAANNVPGSYNDGMAVLQGKTTFKCYLVLNNVALMASVAAVLLLVCGKASRSAGSLKSFVVALHCMWVSLASMFLAYYAALAAVTSAKTVHNITYSISGYGICFLVLLIVKLITSDVSMIITWQFLWRTRVPGRHALFRRRVDRQYPFAGASVPNLLFFFLVYALALAGLMYINTRQYQTPVVSAPAPALL